MYNVTKNKRYRFRVIGAGLIVPLRVSVDNHTLSIVATDGYDVEPVTVESVIINPGERYDFILTADKESSHYWIRVDSMEVKMFIIFEHLHMIASLFLLNCYQQGSCIKTL